MPSNLTASSSSGWTPEKTTNNTRRFQHRRVAPGTLTVL
jgi:hypothetical protein